jgi:hypothetical protein
MQRQDFGGFSYFRIWVLVHFQVGRLLPVKHGWSRLTSKFSSLDLFSYFLASLRGGISCYEDSEH